MRLLIIPGLPLLGLLFCQWAGTHCSLPLGSICGFIVMFVCAFIALWELHIRIFGHRPYFFPTKRRRRYHIGYNPCIGTSKRKPTCGTPEYRLNSDGTTTRITPSSTDH